MARYNREWKEGQLPEHNQLQIALVQVQGAAAERRDEDEDETLGREQDPGLS